MTQLNVDLRGLKHLADISGGYFITTFINNAIPLLVLPVLTRFLAPEQFANVALFCFYLVLVNSVTGISIPSVIAKHFFDSGKKDVAVLIGNSVVVVLGISALALLLILIGYPFLKEYLDLSLFWFLMIPVTSFAFILFSIGLNVMRNEKRRLLFAQHQIGNTAINITLSLVLVTVLLSGWQGRVWGIIIANCISALLMAGYLKANGYLSFRIAKKPIKKILALVIPLIPNSFQSIVISQVGIFFIQVYFSKELLGIYSVGYHLASAIELIKSALAMSWFPYLYEQLAKANDVNRLYLTRLLLAFIAILFMGVLFVNVLNGSILRLMAGKHYYGAREFIPWFTVGFFFHGLYIFLMPFLIKFEKQKFISIVSFVNMVLMIALNICFIKAFGYIGIAYAFVIVYFLMFLAFAWKAQRVFPLPWLGALKVWK